MSKFTEFSKRVEAKYEKLAKDELFVVGQEGDSVWETYLAAFPKGTDPLYETETVHTCSCCRQFVRNIGAVVHIKEGVISTVWDIEGAPYPYDVVAKALAHYVRTLPIVSIFRPTEGKYGHAVSRSMVEGKVVQFEHFEGVIQSRHKSTSIGPDKGRAESAMGVFKRGLEELSLDSLELIEELIVSDDTALYRGPEHLPKLQAFKSLFLQYQELSQEAREAFVWEHSTKPEARFKNSVMGTLISDLSEGVDLTKAVKSFEAKVAPENYRRTKSLITPRMVTEAMKKIEELELRNSLERRHARLSDVSVNDVLFVDNSSRPHMKDALLDTLMAQTRKKPVDLKNVQDISIQEFMETVVPRAESLEVLVENKHLSNFVSVTAPVHEEEPRLFTWKNDFSWSYIGNLADSSLKTRVKAAGGNVTAPFRVSLGWRNLDDLDIHVKEPSGNVIYYGNKGSRSRSGFLDVDMNVGNPVRNAVENVCWQMPRDGDYLIMVHNYTFRESHDVGFTLEVENNGSVAQFEHPGAVGASKKISCLNIKMKGGSIVSIEHPSSLTASGSIAQEQWGIPTQDYAKVRALMKSPNHWHGEQKGQAHWFFILEDCKNPDTTRGMYNENLRADLHPHRKVFEVLGSKLLCPFAEEQLSGVGFSSSQKESITVKVRGDVNQVFNVQI